ncbi:50S ribosomal protein L3 N(5)-glutamine methyltransferase [Inhella gelatinilytica]|uniref:50S ribosomal protein L3 N(5)-glutamine methyltransferase n=1 Tax=Inhella gelatinilytica TaxID=2795030 RepID=A0A931IUD4_9BURK|nr:50S ribosomal protein L3 N(5)-glutamine methyltransferase [Inhella gelatinilytica]MBH9552952.1 50S ribosomal protein L3 N(5)-glutamine methyltransferase [Inhella gelatinilytica]
MILIDAVETAAARLEAAGVAFGQGTLNAFDEAAWLVLWRLGLPLDSLNTHSERELSAAERQSIEALINQRILTRQPTAYLTGEAWLQGVPFFIDARSIVPRSFIAELIAEGSFDAWLSDATHQVLDLCTGNGSLAVLAAMAWPEVEVTGADLSAEALAVAYRNVERHALGHRVQLVQGDGLAAVNGRTFDLVLCNPPYVNAQSMADLPPEFRAEPELALAGGVDGMDFIRRLLAALPDSLNPNGVLVLEIGHERAHFEAAFPYLQPIWLATSAGDDMVLLLTREQLTGDA